MHLDREPVVWRFERRGRVSEPIRPRRHHRVQSSGPGSGEAGRGGGGDPTRPRRLPARSRHRHRAEDPRGLGLRESVARRQPLSRREADPHGRIGTEIFDVDGSNQVLLPIPDRTLQIRAGSWSRDGKWIVTTGLDDTDPIPRGPLLLPVVRRWRAGPLDPSCEPAERLRRRLLTGWIQCPVHPREGAVRPQRTDERVRGEEGRFGLGAIEPTGNLELARGPELVPRRSAGGVRRLAAGVFSGRPRTPCSS